MFVWAKMAAPICCQQLNPMRFFSKNLRVAVCARYGFTERLFGSKKCLLQKRYFGQPASQTHPHLVSQGEVTPGISKEEYEHRRTSLVNRIVQNSKNSLQNHIVILPSASKAYMTHDIPYPFRQNTEFLYLSGFQEPDSALVIHTTSTGYKSVLFVPKRDPDRELWDGPRSGDKGALELTGVSEAYDTDNFESYLYEYCKSYHDYMIWYSLNRPVHEHFHKTVIEDFLKQDGKKGIERPVAQVQQLRVIKSPAEVELMKHTTEIASQAFIDVMKFSKPGINESHLYARMDYECRMKGAEILAYPPVVAGGDRANIIHYINNNQIIQDGEMVLMDAGCEYHGYTSDITRTWPVSGKFTTAQRKVYLSVLAIQQVCISMCTPEFSLSQIYREMVNQIALQLVLLKLVPSALVEDKSKLLKAVNKFCPHHVGHYLGMDVHDTALISKDIKLQPGMVITIEPGIYIKADSTDVPPEYRGIGIRIEDDILITESKPVVLTKSCPKHPDDIEQIMSQTCR
ncbi:xaa-Pro aminopeptidase 3-like [Mercenaria mercenaria]|uniref:xaa-Pro aminopeptidase 3-like n=1 Tax=Mercenaria mercenaria TaxID=6596 RepID=UPI001E1E1E7C|nr:xaa-Pro aminopeptidase 3-like [Mercenaria mercenaria]